MPRHIMVSVKLVLVSTILLGVIYPLLITGMAQLLFHNRANGSLVRQNGHVVGSMLIGQTFARPDYFHTRPSAAGQGYDATASGGSNLSPTSKALADRVKSDCDRLITENPGLRKGAIPVDMVTTSGSGLDPDITPANARAQMARVAVSRRIPEARLCDLIAVNTTDRQFGILGESRVNVLKLNLALDAETGPK